MTSFKTFLWEVIDRFTMAMLSEVNRSVYERVVDFIYREMGLLDDRKYKEWLSLFADDAIYWIPGWRSETEVTEEPEDELNVLYLDKRRLEIYVERLLTGLAYAYEPPARTTRLVSNVVILDRKGDEIDSRAKFILHMFRAQPHELYGPRMQEVFSGDIYYKLKEEGDSFKIMMKKIVLINETVIGGEMYLF